MITKKRYKLNPKGKIIFGSIGLLFGIVGIYINVVLWSCVL